MNNNFKLSHIILIFAVIALSFFFLGRITSKSMPYDTDEEVTRSYLMRSYIETEIENASEAIARLKTEAIAMSKKEIIALSETEDARSDLSKIAVTNIVGFVGEDIPAERFVSYDGETIPLIKYITLPDYNTAGTQDVEILISDGLNFIERTASLTLIKYNNRYSVKIDSNEYVDIRKYIPDNTVNAEFIGVTPNDLRRDKFAEYKLNAIIEGIPVDLIFSVADMTPPSAEAVESNFFVGTVNVAASSLVKNVKDETQVTITYYKEPDFSKEGYTYAGVLLTDEYGNEKKISVKLTIIADIIPPVFTGIINQTIMCGDSISYRRGVSATDNRDGAVTFSVESDVNINKPGQYEVTYTAIDASGNEAISKSYVTVCAIDANAVKKYIDKVIASIISPDMTLDDKIYAVWDYTRSNVSYSGYSDKSDIYHGAYTGLRYGVGDCYTYYAINVLLFNKLGINNTMVRRNGGKANHWWNLVEFSDGEWYFVDSCPLPGNAKKYSNKTSKMTNSTLSFMDDFINAHGSHDNFSDYYKYDGSIYKNYNIAE